MLDFEYYRHWQYVGSFGYALDFTASANGRNGRVADIKKCKYIFCSLSGSGDIREKRRKNQF